MSILAISKVLVEQKIAVVCLANCDKLSMFYNILHWPGGELSKTPKTSQGLSLSIHAERTYFWTCPAELLEHLAVRS